MERLDAGAVNRFKQPISDTDLERYFPETNHYKNNVIKYSDLKNYKNIDELLPTDRSYKIILIENKYNSGHWTAVMRYGDTYEAFDSYGCNPSTELKFINSIIKRLLGEDRDYLGALLNTIKSGKVVYNRKKLQKLKYGSATCGRWVILRILMMKEMGYDLKEFQDFIEKNCDELGVTPDYLVSLWIK